MKNELSLLRSSIAIVGANGGIGRQLVEIALSQGHNVTAILRRPEELTISHPLLSIVQGDVLQPATLEKSLEKKDVVISAIGKNSTKKTLLYSQGNKNIVDLLKNNNTHFFVISASGLEVNPSYSFLRKLAVRYLLQPVLRNMFADLERMEKIVQTSELNNWTIVRPPQLTGGPVTGNYRFATNGFLKDGAIISRADLAHFILSNIKNSALYKTTVEIAY